MDIENITFDGRKETLLIGDRTRDVDYNGMIVKLNIYSCSTCRKDYIFDEPKHSFCPFCGNEYKFIADVSL